MADEAALRRQHIYNALKAFETQEEGSHGELDALNLIEKGLFDPWSEIRRDTAHVLETIVRNFPINLQLDTWISICRNINDDSVPWQTLHGSLLALKVTFGLVESREVQSLHRRLLILLDHERKPICEEALDCICVTGCLKTDIFFSDLLSLINDEVDKVISLEAATTTNLLPSEGKLSCLIRYVTSMQISANDFALLHRALAIATKATGHPSSSTRQVTAKALVAMYFHHSPCVEDIENFILQSITAHATLINVNWMVVECCLIVVDDILKQLIGDYFSPCPQTESGPALVRNHSTSLLRVLGPVIMHLPALVCSDKFEVRRMAVQLLPEIARAVVLFYTRSSHGEYIFTSIVPSGPTPVTEPSQKNCFPHSSVLEAYIRDIKRVAATCALITEISRAARVIMEAVSASAISNGSPKASMMLGSIRASDYSESIPLLVQLTPEDFEWGTVAPKAGILDEESRVKFYTSVNAVAARSFADGCDHSDGRGMLLLCVSRTVKLLCDQSASPTFLLDSLLAQYASQQLDLPLIPVILPCDCIVAAGLREAIIYHAASLGLTAEITRQHEWRSKFTSTLFPDGMDGISVDTSFFIRCMSLSQSHLISSSNLSDLNALFFWPSVQYPVCDFGVLLTMEISVIVSNNFTNEVAQQFDQSGPMFTKSALNQWLAEALFPSLPSIICPTIRGGRNEIYSLSHTFMLACQVVRSIVVNKINIIGSSGQLLKVSERNCKMALWIASVIEQLSLDLRRPNEEGKTLLAAILQVSFSYLVDCLRLFGESMDIRSVSSCCCVILCCGIIVRVFPRLQSCTPQCEQTCGDHEDAGRLVAPSDFNCVCQALSTRFKVLSDANASNYVASIQEEDAEFSDWDDSDDDQDVACVGFREGETSICNRSILELQFLLIRNISRYNREALA